MKKWKILLAAYIAVIFIHSAMPADLSSEESGRITELLLRLHLPVSEYLVRKSAHFLEYLGMGLILQKSLEGGRFAGYERELFTAFACLAVPFVHETIQLFSAGRSSQVTDIWLDMAGAACGVALYAAVRAALPGKSGRRRRNGRR